MSFFNITIPSNSSLNVFPENTPSHFKVQLPKRLHLEGNWTVGLSEIHFPGAWRNIIQGTDQFLLRTVDTTPKNDLYKDVRVELKQGQRLHEAINASIPESFKGKVSFQMHSITTPGPEKFAAEIQLSGGYQVYLPRHIYEYLHISPDTGGLLKVSRKGQAPLSEAELNNAYFSLAAAAQQGIPEDLLPPTPNIINEPAELREGPPAELRRVPSDEDILSEQDWKQRLPRAFAQELNHIFYMGLQKIPNYGQIRKLIFADHGYYASVQELLDNIKNKIRYELAVARITTQFRPELTELPDKRVRITLPPNVKIGFPKKTPGLGALLGFKNSMFEKYHTGTIESTYQADITNGVNSVFIYTNIIKPQLVGDTQVPLLRILPITSDRRLVITKAYDRPDMYQLQSNDLHIIELILANDSGLPLEFLSGKTYIKLSFEKQ